MQKLSESLLSSRLCRTETRSTASTIVIICYFSYNLFWLHINTTTPDAGSCRVP